MKDKYFDGPGGVYYHAITDEIFILKPTGTRLMNKKFEETGRMYTIEYGDKNKCHREVAVLGMDNAVLLDDWNCRD